MTRLPMLLTLSRIVAIPALIGLILVDTPAAAWAASLLYIAAAATDFLDGFVARRRRQQSDLGRFLDPVADKLLVAAAIVALVSLDHIDGWTLVPALIILAREILVAGLREFLASTEVRLPATTLAKWKTAIQFTALGLLIAAPTGFAGLPWQATGEAGLWLAAALTVITGYGYLTASRAHLRATHTG